MVIELYFFFQITFEFVLLIGKTKMKAVDSKCMNAEFLHHDINSVLRFELSTVRYFFIIIIDLIRIGCPRIIKHSNSIEHIKVPKLFVP